MTDTSENQTNHSAEIKRTPLYECHRELGARFVDFRGCDMPVQYNNIQEEHHAVRNHAGLFDVSHMGEVFVTGADAVGAVNTLITNDLEAIADGQACYTAMCNPEGGIVDDLVVYRFNRERVLICVNASNREKDYQYARGQLYDVVEKMQEILNGAMEVAAQSDHPRAYEVAFNGAKHVADAVEKLQDLHKKEKALSQEDAPAAGGGVNHGTVNNVFMTGSTNDLLKMLKETQKEDK